MLAASHILTTAQKSQGHAHAPEKSPHSQVVCSSGAKWCTQITTLAGLHSVCVSWARDNLDRTCLWRRSRVRGAPPFCRSFHLALACSQIEATGVVGPPVFAPSVNRVPIES